MEEKRDAGQRVRRSPVLILAVAAALAASQAQQARAATANSEGISITGVANHGFLIASSGKRVMIDALFTKGGPYVAPSEEELSEMKAARGAFGDVDLVLVTHKHADHFDAGLAAEYLRRNPRAFLAGPPQVVDAMKNVMGGEDLGPRLVSIDVGESERKAEKINDVEIEVIGIPHHLARGVEHVAYLLSMNGMKVLHLGDAAKKPPSIYDGLALERDDVDILIAPFGADCSNWLVDANGDGLEVIRTRIKPKHVLMGHLPVEFDLAKAKTTEARSRLEKQLPGVGVSVMHPEPGARRVYVKRDNKIMLQ